MYDNLIQIKRESPPRFNYKLAKDSSISYHHHQHPNWFHRTMQRWLLGIHWGVNE